jgi:hypothetical protein
MMKKEGTLFYNAHLERADIKFDSGEDYGGLHCGTPIEIMINGDWIQTRIEMAEEWYLVGIETKELAGAKVRV